MATHEETRTGPGEDPGASRVLRGLSHGEHVDQSGVGLQSVEFTTKFDYLFPDLSSAWPAEHLPGDADKVVADLKALGAAMVEDPPHAADPLQASQNSNIPPVYTYWGQFIDHDMTANTDRDAAVSNIVATPFVPLEPDFVTANLANLRLPQLNLDSLYGDGPPLDPSAPTAAASFYDGIKLKVGEISGAAGGPIPGRDVVDPVADKKHDLPRLGAAAVAPDRPTTADIGDGRNDENLIVAQLHVAFLRFHNAVVDWVIANESDCTGDEAVFARARQLVQWHYQWLVVHDYLKTVTLTGTADQVLLADEHLLQLRDGEPYMPLEYSVAAFRFGHTMVRAAYDYNRNFGRAVPPTAPPAPPATSVSPTATFEQLFQFTGKAQAPFLGFTQTLPFNWVIEWDRMVHKHDDEPDHFTRKIDTRLAMPLRSLFNEGEVAEGETPIPAPIKQILKRLATRNLMRGYLLAIPTGQAVAAALGIEPMSAAELRRDNSAFVDDALEAGGFVEATPLWFYILKEAEIQANGNSLGEVGSRIVCETIIGQIRLDETSYLNHGWTPHDGVKLADGDAIVSIADLMRFAGVLA